MSLPRVLVVDDERALLPLLARYLRTVGLEPECVPGVDEARAAFHGADPPFTYVVADLTLEASSGEDLGREFLAADPGVRVLLMSGYPYSTDQLPEPERGRVAFIQKPFMPSMLREVFDQWMKPEAVSAPSDPAGCIQESL